MLTHEFKKNTVFSDNFSSNMDSNRHCLRRAPHKEAEFSSQSIMKAMEKFVQAVQEMDETILVPSRLMVNCVKNKLLWGADSSSSLYSDEETQTTMGKGHVRRPSTTSVASTQSAGSNLSDTDSEAGNENDSGIEAEGEGNSKPDYTQKVEESFRHHLYGLQRSLKQMTEAASYLTKRYQNDIGGAV